MFREQNVIVLDLEWNQGNATREMQDPTMPFEIIEIGAVKLNPSDGESEHFDEYVRPTRYQTMHYVTGKLLKISMDMLQKEKRFPQVFAEFMEWAGENPVFATWGTLDLTELQRNMRFHGLPALSEGPLRFMDVQKMFGRACGNKNERLSLENAVDRIGMDKPFPFHKAVDDAWYTAQILRDMPEEVFAYYSLDCFTLPESTESEVHVTYPTYSKYISRKFTDKHLALEDKEVQKFTCNICGGRIENARRWFSTNMKHYYTFGNCEKDGIVKGKIRLKKAEDEGFYVVKTIRGISDEEEAELREKALKAEKVLKKKEYYENKKHRS